MEDQQGQKNHPSGLETHHHQVHHCHKCGWPFPNPHPSAKHRRAHKRICGNIEGYTLHETSLTNVSDDEHSDGDYKSPQSVRTLERSESGNGSGRTGSVVSQSEDEVFSDAVSNFTDSSPNVGVEGSVEIVSESANAVEKVSEVVPYYGATAEETPAGDSVITSGTVRAPIVAETIADESEKRPDSVDCSPTTLIDTQSDPPGESNDAPKDHANDAESLVGLLTEINSPIENDATTELPLNVPQKNEEVKVIEEMTDTPEAESMLGATHEIFAVSELTEGFAETPQNEIFPEEKPSEHSAVQESEVDDSCDVEHNSKDEEVHVFHVPHDVPSVEHPEEIIEGFKDYKMKEDVQPDHMELEVEDSQDDLGEYNINKEEEGKFNVFSVPQDVPLAVHPEKLIEGFKDYEKMGWVGHDNRDLPNAVEEKGEISWLASDDKEVHVEEVSSVHEGHQLNDFDNLKDSLIAEKEEKGTEEAEDLDLVVQTLSHVTPIPSLDGEVDSNANNKSAVETSYTYEDDGSNKVTKDIHEVPDSASVIEATHISGECLSGEAAEKGVTEEEEVSDIVKSLPETTPVPSLYNDAPEAEDFDLVVQTLSHVTPIPSLDGEVDSNANNKSAVETSYTSEDDGSNKVTKEIHEVPDSASVIEATHISGECLSGEAAEKGVTEEEEVRDIVKSLPETTPVPSLYNDAPGTLILDAKDDDSIEVVGAGSKDDGSNKAEEESSVKIPTVVFTNITETSHAVKDGHSKYVEESCVEIHSIPDSVTVGTAGEIVTGEAVTKVIVEEKEVSDIVETPSFGKLATRTFEGLDRKGDDIDNIYAVAVETSSTAEVDGSNNSVEENSAGSPSVPEKTSLDVGEKPEESSVELHIVPDSTTEIGGGDGVRKETMEESTGGELLFDHKDGKGEDDSIGKEEGTDEVALVESRRKSTEEFEDANETLTDGSEAETATVGRGLASEELKSGDEVEGKNEFGGEDHQLKKEDVDAVLPLVPNSSAVEGGYDKDGASLQQPLTASALDASSSRSESLDANWGSVSVLSTQSDTIALTDDSREVGKSNSKQAPAVRHSEKTEAFEAPSFMTLVESTDNTCSVSQQKKSQGQPGWFPSLTHTSNDSPGRKKNEEIIAKVTNWSTKQQQPHSPLKNLLVEANRQNKPSSPIPKENIIDTVVPKGGLREEDSGKDNGGPTVGSILSSDVPPPKAKNEAKPISDEWNSPARYPTEINREKKAKGRRPYWAQFVCCSSGN